MLFPSTEQIAKLLDEGPALGLYVLA